MAKNHEQYLNDILSSKRNELKNIKTEHKIAIAVFNTKSELIKDQIDSIERQLNI